MSEHILDTLKQLAKALAIQFGSDCEIVIHDLKKKHLENSIVYIENSHVSGRSVGYGPSQIVLNALKHSNDKLSDKLSYLTKSENGHILKSSTIFIREDNEVRYVLGINHDITNLIALENSINKIISYESPEDNLNKPKNITQNVNNLLDDLIDDSVKMIGKPVPLMTKEEKITALEYLNDAGAFLITKSGDKIANYFGISKFTLYNYIEINK